MDMTVMSQKIINFVKVSHTIPEYFGEMWS